MAVQMFYPDEFNGAWIACPVNTTLEQLNHRELALGSHSRSGDQWNVWESVYSPVGAAGRGWARLGAAGRGWARLGAAGPQAPRQAAPLRRRHGQLLPQQRGVRGGEVPAAGGSAGGRGGGLWGQVSFTRFRGRLTRPNFGAEVAHELQGEGRIRRAACATRVQ